MENIEIKELLKKRANYRLSKNYQEADKIKNQLLSSFPDADIMDSINETWFLNCTPYISIIIHLLI